MAFIIKNGKRVYAEAFEYDESPLYAASIVYDEDGIGHVDHRAAYDPQHECRCDRLPAAHGVRECAA